MIVKTCKMIFRLVDDSLLKSHYSNQIMLHSKMKNEEGKAKVNSREPGLNLSNIQLFTVPAMLSAHISNTPGVGVGVICRTCMNHSYSYNLNYSTLNRKQRVLNIFSFCFTLQTKPFLIVLFGILY